MSGSAEDEGDYLCGYSQSPSHIPISCCGRSFSLKQTQSRCVQTQAFMFKHTNTHTHTERQL